MTIPEGHVRERHQAEPALPLHPCPRPAQSSRGPAGWGEQPRRRRGPRSCPAACLTHPPGSVPTMWVSCRGAWGCLTRLGRWERPLHGAPQAPWTSAGFQPRRRGLLSPPSAGACSVFSPKPGQEVGVRGWGRASQGTCCLPWGPEVRAGRCSPRGLAFPEGKGRGELGREGAWQPYTPSRTPTWSQT